MESDAVRLVLQYVRERSANCLILENTRSTDQMLLQTTVFDKDAILNVEVIEGKESIVFNIDDL